MVPVKTLRWDLVSERCRFSDKVWSNVTTKWKNNSLHGFDFSVCSWSVKERQDCLEIRGIACNTGPAWAKKPTGMITEQTFVSFSWFYIKSGLNNMMKLQPLRWIYNEQRESLTKELRTRWRASLFLLNVSLRGSGWQAFHSIHTISSLFTVIRMLWKCNLIIKVSKEFLKTLHDKKYSISDPGCRGDDKSPSSFCVTLNKL